MLLMAVAISSPRFDTPWRAVLNGVGIAVWIAAVVSIIADRRRGGRVSIWGWIAIVANVAMSGVYIPVGPVIWLAGRAVGHQRQTPTSGTRGG